MGHKHCKSSPHSSLVPTAAISITPLYEACRDGNEDQVRQLLPKYSHTDINRQEYPYGGNTCLHIAAANGHDNIVKLLLEHGSYRSSILNAQNQSAYDVATLVKESTRLLFVRQDENDPSSKSSSRFYEHDPSECFDVVKLEDNPDNELKTLELEKRASIQTFKTEEEIRHEIGYSASSKAMCQSRVGRFCVNHFHSDEPLDHHTIIEHLRNLLEKQNIKNSNDDVKAGDLMTQYEKNSNSVERLLHLYTLETQFYRSLKQDCLPLAIPLFMHLEKLKERFYQGRSYRGMHMTFEQLLIYQIAMRTPETRLQTSSFSSTSIERHVAEQFAYVKAKKHQEDLCVLFIFDFPNLCDQAINLSRISSGTACLSEYEDEKEVLILPWTLFEVTRIEKPSDEDELYTIYLKNIKIPKKNLISSLKWSWDEIKNQLSKDQKLKLDCAFQKYKPTKLTTTQ